MKTFLKLGTAFLLLQSSYVLSNESFPVEYKDLETFFQPIEQSLQNEIFKDNQFSLKRLTYFGKRYRIVKANLDLLAENSGPFILNPFEDRHIVVETENIRDQHRGTSRTWTGKKLSSRLDVDDPKISSELKHQINSMNLYIHTKRQEGLDEDLSRQVISYDPSVVQIGTIIYISGQLRDFHYNYQIMPADSTYENFIIIELDRKKSLVSGGSDSARDRRNSHAEFEARIKQEEVRYKERLPVKKGGPQ
mgnify:FL=1